MFAFLIHYLQETAENIKNIKDFWLKNKPRRWNVNFINKYFFQDPCIEKLEKSIIVFKAKNKKS